MLLGIGLPRTRDIFLEIHPTWNNTPQDAANLTKVGLKLNKEEEKKFDAGNIEEWDLSLVTTVLLFSPTNCNALKTDQKFAGYFKALKDLKSCRNNFLGHTKSEKLPDQEFRKCWPQVKDCLLRLGITEEKTNNVLAGKWGVFIAFTCVVNALRLLTG